MATLREQVRDFPDAPGVYLYRDATGRVLYVGKAKSLKKRVASYFNRPGDAKTTELLRAAHDVEFVVTTSAAEALLLENNLIKKKKPRYNILLRDDKTYPYIKITTSEAYPRATLTRRVADDGNLYFGPFYSSALARRALRLLARGSMVRTCRIKIDGKRPRPCLYYYIHRCLGPCKAGLTTKEEYDDAVQDVVMMLSGRNRELLGKAEAKMVGAASAERFEMAAYYRDLIRSVRELGQRQSVSSLAGDDADVFAAYEQDGNVALCVLVVRAGQVVDQRQIYWEGVELYEPAEFFGNLLTQYYEANVEVPPEIHLPIEIADADLLESWLGERRGERVEIAWPRRGVRAQRLDLARENARQHFGKRFRADLSQEAEARRALRDLLGLSRLPERIECFDISHVQGTDTVAAMAVYDRGRTRPSEYRLYTVRSASGQSDDFRSIAEAVERRYRRLAADPNARFPDLILVDGGKGQVSAAAAALAGLGLVPANAPAAGAADTPAGPALAGLAKREEEVFVPGVSAPLPLERRHPASMLLQRVRDEAHRFAITAHRKKRRRRTLRSELQDLPGIGAPTARRLLRTFGSLAAIRLAPAADLASALGPGRGARLYEQLHVADAATEVASVASVPGSRP